MAKPISDLQKKRGRGRPATGTDPQITIRMPKQILARLAVWAKESGMTRTQAIRLFVEHGLARPPRLKPKSKL